ncbi:MAG: hypothetical protein WCO00_15490 [Rhodospirillaceae bacterium]
MLPTLPEPETAAAPSPKEGGFDLRCGWQGQEGHPHLAVGYVVAEGETLWGVYICSATYKVPGNEWSFTLPMSFGIHEVTIAALNAIAWDRFAVIEEERPDFDDAAKHFILDSLRTIVSHSQPCRLVTAIKGFLGG